MLAVGSPDSFVETRSSREIGWVREDLAGHGLEPFWGEVAAMPEAKGRGGVGRLAVGGLDLVVRPYRRGGALARLLGDRYLSPARAKAELDLLCALRGKGILTVAPVAAIARRQGACWRLRLCTELLKGARPLPAFLARAPNARREAVGSVAELVRAAFEAGLRHPDLHVDNILCTEAGGAVQAALVDLDRARLAPPLSAAARDGMLARMQRYLLKHRASLAASPTLAETLRFLRGLDLDRAARRRVWQRLGRAPSR